MTLRKAQFSELPVIWEILKQAIEQRKLEGSKQWQNGYPNEEKILQDFRNGNAFVFLDNEVIIACAAIIFDGEPTYKEINGNWLTNCDYATIHRVATSNAVKRKGVATSLFKEIENYCLEKGIYSIRADTNYDNAAMLKIFKNLNYHYCGEILMSSAPRKAFEKILTKF